MTEKKLDERLIGALKRDQGYDDEEIKIIEGNPKQREIVEAGPILIKKKLVGTCIEAEGCAYHKVGDRYVFNAQGGMIKDETCDTPCLFAMGTFTPFCYMAYDRAASGLDPNDMHWDHVRCLDTGCRYGGFGTAMFKMSVEDA